jgi:hypothetical protein
MPVKLAKIPPEIQAVILPKKDISILDFLKFSLPAVALGAFTQPQTFFSTLDPTIADAEVVRKTLMPPLPVLNHLLQAKELHDQARSIVFSSHQTCSESPDQQFERFPMWILSYWTETARIWPLKRKWVLAEEGIEYRRRSKQQTDVTDHTKGLIAQVYDALASISWSDTIKGFPGTALMDCLTTYLTKDWLTDEHEDQMLYLLECDMTRSRKDDRTHIANAFFITRLVEIYKDPNRTDHYATSKGLAWLRKKGQEFGTGALEKLVTIANVGRNHWVAVEVDFECSKILYGDSLGGKINEEIETALTWWLHQHSAKHFTTDLLPITRQRDDYSCGILAWNAIATKMFPERYSLMDDDSPAIANERLKIFLEVVERHNSASKVRKNLPPP